MRPIYSTATSLFPTDAPPTFILADTGNRTTTPQADFARAVSGNLIEHPSLAQHLPSDSGRILLWSGWFEPEAEGCGLPSPMTWSASAWSKLTTFCATLAALHPSSQFCLLPQAGHILSDLPSCLRFLNTRSSWADAHAHQFEILLDPVGMLTFDMLPHAPDHLERMFMGLGNTQGVAGVFLSNLAPNSLARQPIHEGILAHTFLSTLLSAHCQPDLPLMLLEQDLAAQLTLLDLTST